MGPFRLLFAVFLLVVVPGTAFAQREKFVEAAGSLARAAQAGHADSTAVGKAVERLASALREWDLGLEAQQHRVDRELADAPAQRRFQLHIEMGVAYRARGRLADALREFDAAAELAPASSDVHLLRALTLESSGRPEAAAPAFRDAWLHDPENAMKAYYLVARGSNVPPDDIARARKVLLEHYETLLRTAPQGGTGGVNPPFVVLDAIPDLLGQTPIVGDMRTANGFALLAAGKYADAVATLSGTTVSATDDPLRHFLEAQAAEKDNRTADARAGYTAALAGALSGRSVIDVAIGRLAQVDGDLPAAIDAFSHAVRLNPNDPTMRQELATAYAAAGRDDDAFAELVAGLLINPGQAALHAAIGQLRLDTGHAADAIPSFRRALELSPERYEVRYALATALARSGKPDEAARELKQFEQTRRERLERRRQQIQEEVDKEEAIRGGRR
jgi:tetratricopeptide (TPR) repeat protein